MPVVAGQIAGETFPLQSGQQRQAFPEAGQIAGEMFAL